MWPSVLLLGLLVSIANFNVTAYSVPTNFGCKNSLISDEWRKAVLRFHNNKRRALAEGKVKTKDGKAAPMAKNMNELVRYPSLQFNFYSKESRPTNFLEQAKLWDCNIETHAFENTCNGVVDQNYYGVTDTFKNKKTCNAAVNTEELLKKWWDESKAIDLTASQSYDATAEQNAPKFSHMAAATAKAFACSYSTCSGSDSKLLCVYEKY
ncbi:hypothetical protein Y032_0048g1589 [Ancylostoma ceylanicum]|uniref:SCP domain-containing protein n=1 Tax=Ancylostoma ceylanicum TaxID=53326 RepID=A0A016UAA5_9BILA|nr:hypothetical protein Y032_0048g1589 [Ancylostoma ceylanicum]